MNEITVQANQALHLPILWTGKETELSYAIALAGNNAKLILAMILIGKHDQHLNVRLTVNHNAPQTKSEVHIKGILFDNAQITIDGLVKIRKGAKGTNAHLASHMLLLSEQAKGSVTPSLEIAENDVKAGHAATVGRINDMQLFYLMSRGLSKETAKRLITEGFLADMLNRFPKELVDKARKQIF